MGAARECGRARKLARNNAAIQQFVATTMRTRDNARMLEELWDDFHATKGHLSAKMDTDEQRLSAVESFLRLPWWRRMFRSLP